MNRESDKHGPRLDDDQKQDGVGSTHVEEWRQQEDPLPRGSYPPGHEPGTPEGISAEGVDQRSELAKWLSDADYPADRGTLRAHAERASAPDFVLEAVDGLPEGTRFANIAAVAKELGLGIERKRW
ncbi:MULTISPECIES: DUF2795 domain-containing protein [Nonomuraea]|jgi:hypothetical protein|uniref:DUF2795 domain-containing protein n=2 Tax=Nonomuraea TaxID=83681 RepID=A0A7W5V1X6_9ACTN|nr:DUF2795 domain-containing protein [Nonomuraea dietziae]MBB3727304.1 hypothetical protein [Nonomuraea dietziae]